MFIHGWIRYKLDFYATSCGYIYDRSSSGAVFYSLFRKRVIRIYLILRRTYLRKRFSFFWKWGRGEKILDPMSMHGRIRSSQSSRIHKLTVDQPLSPSHPTIPPSSVSLSLSPKLSFLINPLDQRHNTLSCPLLPLPCSLIIIKTQS